MQLRTPNHPRFLAVHIDSTMLLAFPSIPNYAKVFTVVYARYMGPTMALNTFFRPARPGAPIIGPGIQIQHLK